MDWKIVDCLDCRKPSIKIRIVTPYGYYLSHFFRYCRKPSIKIRIVTMFIEKVNNEDNPIAENHLLK